MGFMIVPLGNVLCAVRIPTVTKNETVLVLSSKTVPQEIDSRLHPTPEIWPELEALEDEEIGWFSEIE